MSSSHSDTVLLDSTHYVDDLIQHIAHAKHRVYLMSLIFTDDASTHQLINALLAAAQRKVIVSIAADAFTFGEFGGYFSPFKRQHPKSRHAIATADRLKTAGIEFTWLADTVHLNPFAGVTHCKWTIVDDTCYTFGGVNLYKDGIKSTDYMLRFLDPQFANILIKQHTAIIQSDHVRQDYAGMTAVMGLGTGYIDSGEKGDSVIYQRAVSLASQATHILYVSQYCPSGPLATIIRKSSASVYFNQPSNATFPSSLMIGMDIARTAVRSRYRRKKYLHAKFMIFTMPDGKKIALTGSHNFSYTGVRFGTREIALETTDPLIIQELTSFFDQHIA